MARDSETRRQIKDPETGLLSNAVERSERYNVKLMFEVTKLTTGDRGQTVQEKYLTVPGYEYFGMNYALMVTTEKIMANTIGELANVGIARGVLSQVADES